MTIYFVLPDFYHNFKLNYFLYQLTMEKQTTPFKHPVHFNAASGTFPFSLWNGQYNCVDGAIYDGKLFPLFRDYSCFRDINMPVRLNCSNSCLDDFMFDDEHMNTILRVNENINNYIEASNLKLIDYISEHYPKYKFVFSDNADIINELTPEMINTLAEFDQLDKIKIPFKYAKDFDFLKEIKHRQKMEIVVNSLCPITCPSYNECKIISDEAQTNYSKTNPFFGCYKNNDYIWNTNNTISLDDINDKYLPLGFNHFSFAPLPNIQLYNKIIYYFSYFFQPEEVVKMMKLFNDEAGIFQ